MKFSVVVGIVDGGDQLERCLAALASQAAAPPIEVIVPWDDSIAGIEAFIIRYPGFRFLAMGHVATLHPATSNVGLHELYDKRRAAGLRETTGDLVALLEDRSVPTVEWAHNAVALHARLPNGVIGGAIADGRDTLVGHADYLCDFARYQPPFAGGPREYVSNVNICYKRAALDRTRELWADTYYDLTVHWALQKEGEQLWLAPEMEVRQMRGDGTPLGRVLAERVAWGRRFAVRRVAAAGRGSRLRFALQSPLVPLVLWWRVARDRRGSDPAVFAAAAPVILLIYGAWGLGELIGYVTGKQ
ncbi:MAG TPA: hypothetical protein VGI92_08140 [Gemmatimonadales bacterium]